MEADFATGPILLPITGMGTGIAQLRAGKRLLAGRLSIPASSEQSMPFLGFFWPWGSLDAGSLGSNIPGIIKNNSKICFIPEPLPGWDYFWNEGVARQCQGDVGVPVPSPGSPTASFWDGSGSLIPTPRAQPCAGSNPFPFPKYSCYLRIIEIDPEMQGSIQRVLLMEARSRICFGKQKTAEPKGRESCAMEKWERSVSHGINAPARMENLI